MMNDPNDWKKVRHLALLALATFTDRRLRQREGDESTEGNGRETNQ